jgi:hypothetical protein
MIEAIDGDQIDLPASRARPVAHIAAKESERRKINLDLP